VAKSISIAITGNAAPLRKAINEATGLFDGMSRRISPKVLAVGAAFSATAGAVAYFGKQFAEAAAEDEQSQRQLALALQNTLDATNATIASTESFIGAMQLATGVADTELRSALAGLTRATGDLFTAQELLRLSLDVSAATGKDLSAVQQALAKSATGNLGALTKLGIPLDKNIIKTKDLAGAVDVLQELYGGAASERAETFAGKMERLNVRVDELQEKMGTALLPILERFVDVGIELIDTYNESGLGGVFRDFTRNADGTLNTVGKLYNIFAELQRIGAGLYAPIKGLFQALTGDFSDVQVKLLPKLKDLTAVQNAARTESDRYLTKLQQLNEAYGETRGQVDRNIKSLLVFNDTTTSGTKAVDKVAEKLKNLRAALRDAKTAAEDYVAKIASAVTSTISFGTALDEQAAADARVADAIEARNAAQRKADEEFRKVEGQSDGWLEYYQAIDQVGRAENELAKARKAREETSYTSVFQKQITAAKEFAGNLKALIAAGLRGAGLEQVLNLGPVAGNQVAKDLLAGVGGLTVGGLMSTLAEAEATARSVGLSIPEVAGVLGATAGRTQGNIYLTVQAGVGDPAAIGATVVDYLQKYQQRVGRLPLKVA
jgi:hypothetical protein